MIFTRLTYIRFFCSILNVPKLNNVRTEWFVLLPNKNSTLHYSKAVFLHDSHINYEALLDFLSYQIRCSEQGARRDIKLVIIQFSSIEALTILFRVSHRFSCIPWRANSSV